MRTIGVFAAGVLGLVVAGCGSGDESTTSDPSRSAAAEPEVELVSGPDTGGGTTEQQATRVTSASERSTYAGSLPAPLQDPFLTAADRLRPTADQDLWAQTVHVGCSAPSADQITVDRSEDEVTLSAAVKDDTLTCVTATRTVAIAVVPGR